MDCFFSRNLTLSWKGSKVEEESVVVGEGVGGEDVKEGGFFGAAGAHHY